MKDFHTVKIEDTKGEIYTFTLHWDADIHEWVELFRKILYCLTFSNELIEEALGEEHETKESTEE